MPPINEWMGLGGGIYDGDKTMAFELNQIMAFAFRSPEVLIGENLGVHDNLITIFDPELALIGKLDKIPIMRSLRIQLNDVPDIMKTLIADTGNFEVKWLLQLFNDNNYNDPENPGSAYQWNGKKPNLIGIASKYAHLKLTTNDEFGMETNNFYMQFQGGIPLKPRLLFRNELGFSAVVAGTDVVRGGIGHGMIFIEVDWKTINKREFDEYIREYIYVQE